MVDINDLFSLKDKTVIITGGAGHLGHAMSEALAASGANLFILGHNSEKNMKFAKDIKTNYKNDICLAIQYDLDDDDSIKRAIGQVMATTGKIDVLVNNSAYSCSKPLHEYEYDEWQKGIDGTLNGVFRMTKQVLPVMMRQNSGSIINIGSMYGMVAPNMEIYGDSGQNNPANYGAGKAAIIQLTRYIASVYAKYGIRANAISPGPFPNPNVQQDRRFVGELCKKNPMGCIGQPEDLQGIVIYLASDASKYTNGQNIAVDGGWTAW